MKTIKEIAMELLLDGQHINKGDFHAQYHTFTLTQRIEEIRKGDEGRNNGWDVKSKSIPGRKGMVEYWLEPSEIERIKNKQSRTISEQNASDEQLLKENKNLAEKASESLKNEDKAYYTEQLGIGLLGGHNY